MSNASIVDGTVNELYGYQLSQTERTELTGMCGKFEVAGCCFKSATGIMSEMSSSGGIDANISAALGTIDMASQVVKQACMAAGHTGLTHIGAPACQMATTRNGGIVNSNSWPKFANVRRRLRLSFAGDLNTLTDGQKQAIRDSVKSKIESALGSGTVESVELSSGSIVATVTFPSDVDGDEVQALTSDVTVTQMTVSDGETSFQQTGAPSTDVDSSGSSASSTQAVLGLLLGLVAATITI